MLRKLISSALISPRSPIFPLALQYSWAIPVAAVLVLFASAAEGIGISLLTPLLDAAAGTGVKGSGPFAMVAGWFAPDIRVIAISGMILAGIMLKGILSAASSVFVNWIDGRVGHVIRTSLAERLLRADYPFLLQSDPVRALNILSTESWRASEAIQLMFRSITNIATIVVFLVIVAVLNWQLCVVTLAGVAALRGLQSLATRHVRTIGTEVVAANLSLGERMVAICLGIARLVRLFGRERHEQARFDQSSETVRRTMLSAAAAAAVVGPVFEALYAAFFLTIFVVANALGITLSTLIVFLILMYRMQPAIRDLSAAGVEIGSRRAAIEEVEWLLDATARHPGPAGGAKFPGLRQGLVFDGVTFEYPAVRAEGAALRDVSFAVRPNSATALIGRSGSGKSTIVNLLARLIEPSSGKITIDGVALADMDPVELRRHVAIAGQDAELFDGTVAENIAYGRDGATDAEIADAARRADAHDFIASLPLGYATTLKGPGFGLSGGQRQRIGLARALLRDPDLLILDEATSALDHVSERAIMEIVSHRRDGQTLLVISHRQSTIDYCEDCVVLDGGKLVAAKPTREVSSSLVAEAIR